MTGVPPSGSEAWRPLAYAPRYAISSLGRVRNTASGNMMPGQVDSRGYRRVHLRLGSKWVKVRVHRLVCETFHGAAPNGTEVCHADGNRLNNSADNLRWGTRSENVRDAIAHGTHVGDLTIANAVKREMRSVG